MIVYSGINVIENSKLDIFIHIAINITSFNTYKKSKEKTKNEYPTKPKLQTLEHGAIVDGFDKFR